MFLAAAEATAGDQLFVVKFGADCAVRGRSRPSSGNGHDDQPVALFGHVDVTRTRPRPLLRHQEPATILFLRAGGSSSSSSSSSNSSSPGDVVAKIEAAAGAGPRHSTTRSWSSRRGGQGAMAANARADRPSLARAEGIEVSDEELLSRHHLWRRSGHVTKSTRVRMSK